MDTTEALFSGLLKDKGIELNDTQILQFDLYYRELVSWNEKMNLTSITEREQVYIKHFYDSLSLSFYVPMDGIQRAADIGSGAGFPGIPLKILYPHLRLVIVDSLNKRITFLKHLVETLGMTEVACVHGRAEEIARMADYRDGFDLGTARAVARLNVLNELCLPFVRQGGVFVAMKGTSPDEELREAKASMKELRAELEQVSSFALPVERSERHIIVLRKTGATPAKYPRKPGSPLKLPIK